jgi:hypothetical protein
VCLELLQYPSDQICWICSFCVLEKMRMLLRYTMRKLFWWGGKDMVHEVLEASSSIGEIECHD